jgi:hypothetical protein
MPPRQPVVVSWLADRIREIERFRRPAAIHRHLREYRSEVAPVAEALNAALAEHNIQVMACREGQAVGQESNVRVFDIQHIKGLEFEAVFFIGIDQLAALHPALFDKYLYVGTTRAATYLGVTCDGALPPAIEELRPLFGSTGKRPNRFTPSAQTNRNRLMAFDQTTRNRLQRFVNDARRVLEEEFTRQLQNDYGMDPNSGTVAELASLRHINDAQRETARILRDTLAHYCASRHGCQAGAGPHRARAGLHRAQPLGRLAHGRGARPAGRVGGQRLPGQGLSALCAPGRHRPGRNRRCLPHLPVQRVR